MGGMPRISLVKSMPFLMTDSSITTSALLTRYSRLKSRAVLRRRGSSSSAWECKPREERARKAMTAIAR
jgi:hypothetical protein